MLLLFSYLFISVGYVFGVPNTFDIGKHEITVDDNVLISVHTYNPIETKHFVWANKYLVGIDKNAFKNLNEILYIELDYNKLSNLSQSLFSPLKHLQSLSITWNRLRDINFLLNVSATLEILMLDWNELSNLSDSSFAHFTHLKKLSLSNNKLTNIKFTDSLSPTLTELNLKFNRISELPPGCFRHLNQLINLNLSFNRIATLVDSAFDGLANIRTLSLSFNDLEAINSESFKRLANTLVTLDLSGNDIRRLKKGTFNLTRTSELKLAANRLSEIEKGSLNMPNLQFLDLDYNPDITVNLETFTGLPQLKVLHLRYSRHNVSETERNETISNRDVLVKYNFDLE